MNIDQLKGTFSPWIGVVMSDFSRCFLSDYDMDILQFLHENIDKEIKTVYSRNNENRTKALYNALTYLYNHMCWKINHQKECPNVKMSCVKLLSQIIKTGLILSKGSSKSEWIDRILTAIGIFAGKFRNQASIYDALLLISLLKPKYHSAFIVVLKHVLTSEEQECITEPLVYMEVILLFRRLKGMLKNKQNRTCVTLLAAKIKPPSNLISWLMSLDLKGVGVFKYKTIAKQLMKNKVPSILLKKVKELALSCYAFKPDSSTTSVQGNADEPSDLFVIDTSSTVESCSGSVLQFPESVCVPTSVKNNSSKASKKKKNQKVINKEPRVDTNKLNNQIVLPGKMHGIESENVPTSSKSSCKSSKSSKKSKKQRVINKENSQKCMVNNEVVIPKEMQDTKSVSEKSSFKTGSSKPSKSKKQDVINKKHDQESSVDTRELVGEMYFSEALQNNKSTCISISEKSNSKINSSKSSKNKKKRNVFNKKHDQNSSLNTKISEDEKDVPFIYIDNYSNLVRKKSDVSGNYMCNQTESSTNDSAIQINIPNEAKVQLSENETSKTNHGSHIRSYTSSVVEKLDSNEMEFEAINLSDSESSLQTCSSKKSTITEDNHKNISSTKTLKRSSDVSDDKNVSADITESCDASKSKKRKKGQRKTLECEMKIVDKSASDIIVSLHNTSKDIPEVETKKAYKPKSSHSCASEEISFVEVIKMPENAHEKLGVGENLNSKKRKSSEDSDSVSLSCSENKIIKILQHEELKSVCDVDKPLIENSSLCQTSPPNLNSKLQGSINVEPSKSFNSKVPSAQNSSNILKSTKSSDKDSTDISKSILSESNSPFVETTGKVVTENEDKSMLNSGIEIIDENSNSEGVISLCLPSSIDSVESRVEMLAEEVAVKSFISNLSEDGQIQCLGESNVQPEESGKEAAVSDTLSFENKLSKSSKIDSEENKISENVFLESDATSPQVDTSAISKVESETKDENVSNCSMKVIEIDSSSEDVTSSCLLSDNAKVKNSAEMPLEERAVISDLSEEDSVKCLGESNVQTEDSDKDVAVSDILSFENKLSKYNSKSDDKDNKISEHVNSGSSSLVDASTVSEVVSETKEESLSSCGMKVIEIDSSSEDVISSCLLSDKNNAEMPSEERRIEPCIFDLSEDDSVKCLGESNVEPDDSVKDSTVSDTLSFENLIDKRLESHSKSAVKLDSSLISNDPDDISLSSRFSSQKMRKPEASSDSKEKSYIKENAKTAPENRKSSILDLLSQQADIKYGEMDPGDKILSSSSRSNISISENMPLGDSKDKNMLSLKGQNLKRKHSDNSKPDNESSPGKKNSVTGGSLSPKPIDSPVEPNVKCDNNGQSMLLDSPNKTETHSFNSETANISIDNFSSPVKATAKLKVNESGKSVENEGKIPSVIKDYSSPRTSNDLKLDCQSSENESPSTISQFMTPSQSSCDECKSNSDKFEITYVSSFDKKSKLLTSSNESLCNVFEVIDDIEFAAESDDDIDNVSSNTASEVNADLNSKTNEDSKSETVYTKNIDEVPQKSDESNNVLTSSVSKITSTINDDVGGEISVSEAVCTKSIDKVSEKSKESISDDVIINLSPTSNDDTESRTSKSEAVHTKCISNVSQKPDESIDHALNDTVSELPATSIDDSKRKSSKPESVDIKLTNDVSQKPAESIDNTLNDTVSELPATSTDDSKRKCSKPEAVHSNDTNNVSQTPDESIDNALNHTVSELPATFTDDSKTKSSKPEAVCAKNIDAVSQKPDESIDNALNDTVCEVSATFTDDSKTKSDAVYAKHANNISQKPDESIDHALNDTVCELPATSTDDSKRKSKPDAAYAKHTNDVSQKPAESIHNTLNDTVSEIPAASTDDSKRKSSKPEAVYAKHTNDVSQNPAESIDNTLNDTVSELSTSFTDDSITKPEAVYSIDTNNVDNALNDTVSELPATFTDDSKTKPEAVCAKNIDAVSQKPDESIDNALNDTVCEVSATFTDDSKTKSDAVYANNISQKPDESKNNALNDAVNELSTTFNDDSITKSSKPEALYSKHTNDVSQTPDESIDNALNDTVSELPATVDDSKTKSSKLEAICAKNIDEVSHKPDESIDNALNDTVGELSATVTDDSKTKSGVVYAKNIDVSKKNGGKLNDVDSLSPCKKSNYLTIINSSESINILNVSDECMQNKELSTNNVNLIKELQTTLDSKTKTKNVKEGENSSWHFNGNSDQGTSSSRVSSKTSTTDYFPYSSKSKNYLSFSDISLSNKELTSLDSELKSPNQIRNFAFAATTEIFSSYRNDSFSGEDKISTDPITKDDVSSNCHELSDDGKSQNLSSDECDSRSSVGEVDNQPEEVENIPEAFFEVSLSYDNSPVKNIKASNVTEMEAGSDTNKLQASPIEKKKDPVGEDCNSPLVSENECIEKPTAIVSAEQPRYSLRQKNKSEIKDSTILEEDALADVSSENNKKEWELPETEIIEEIGSKPEKSSSVCGSPKDTSSVCPIESVPDLHKSSGSTLDKNAPKNSLPRKSKAKESSLCRTPPRRYSLRQQKSKLKTDDSSKLGIDISQLHLDSPSSRKNPKETSIQNEILMAKLLALEKDSPDESNDESDLTSDCKRETRSSVAKTLKEDPIPNTPGYNLRNRKSIITPAKLKI